MFPSVIRHLEQERKDETPRIGVFVCHCGHNIAGYLDVPALVQSARTLPYVVLAQDSLFACSDAGLTQIRAAIPEHNLNRVVVASSCRGRRARPTWSACSTNSMRAG